MMQKVWSFLPGHQGCRNRRFPRSSRHSPILRAGCLYFPMLPARLSLAFSALSASALLAAAPALAAQTSAPHPITLSDLYRFQNVGSPVVSPDG